MPTQLKLKDNEIFPEFVYLHMGILRQNELKEVSCLAAKGAHKSSSLG